jgi:ketose-bisphosphate aldolase
MKLHEKLKSFQKEKKALLAANYYNLETCKGILLAAKDLNHPVILQLTKSSIDYMGLKAAVQIGRILSKELEVEAWLHLDHCDNIELIKRCLDEGFDSVMIDASDKSFEENIEISRKVVALAENYDANVEAELGSVPKLGKELEDDKFTEPGEAKIFVERTGINALAVAIGTKHGFYKGEPKLDLERLNKIRQVTDVCLVLHGGSGIPEPVLKRSIELGIVKVNVATETKDIFIKTLRNILQNSNEIDLRKIFPDAINSVKELIISKMKIVSL